MSKINIKLFFILFFVVIFLSNVSATSQEEEAVNTRINYVNSQIIEVSESFASEDVETSISKLVGINERLSNELTSLYNDIVKIRNDNPSFKANQIIEYPDNLRASYYENIDKKLKKAYLELKDDYKKAKFDHGLVKFKTAMAVVLNAAIVYNDAMGMAGTSGETLSKTVVNQVLNYGAGYTSGKINDPTGVVDAAKILKNNIDKLKEEGPEYEEYLKEYYSLKSDLLKRHQKMSRSISYLEQYMDDFRKLEILITNAQKHIGSASDIVVFDLNEVSFSVFEFTNAFDDLLEDLEDEEITWSTYVTRKKSIFDSFELIVSNIYESGKYEEYKDKILEVNEHYYSFDEGYEEKREELYSDLQIYMNDWKVSIINLINYYNELNFYDLDVVDIDKMETTYVEDDDSPSQLIGKEVSGVSYGIGIESEDDSWYQGMISVCESAADEVELIYGIANNAVESSANPYKASETFAVLRYDQSFQNTGLSNMRGYRTFISNLPSYLDNKFVEISKLQDYIDDVQSIYDEIINFEESNSFYITQMDFLNFRVNNYKDKIKLNDMYFYFLDTDKLLNYISNELLDIETQIDDIDVSCYSAKSKIYNIISKEEDFIAFVGSFDSKVNSLKNKMEKHMDFLNTIEELRDYHQTYESLLSFQSKEEISGNYDVLKSYYDQFLNYEDLDDFISVQNDIKELKSQIMGGPSANFIGFDGDFAVLEESRDSVQELLDMSFLFGGYYTEENLKAGIPEVQNLLDGNLQEGVVVDEIKIAADDLEKKLEGIKSTQNEEYIRTYFIDAQVIWNSKILKSYADNDGWDFNSETRGNYERAKSAYIKICDLVQKDVEEQFSSKRFIPDESFVNPIDSVLLNIHGSLEKYGLEDYKERWLYVQENKNKLTSKGEVVSEWSKNWKYGFDFSWGLPSVCEASCYECDSYCYDCSSGECYVCVDSCYSCDKNCYNPDAENEDIIIEYNDPSLNEHWGYDDGEPIPEPGFNENLDEENKAIVEEFRRYFDYIEEGMALPSFVPYSNEVFNIYTLDEYDIGSIILENKTIISYSFEVKDDSTYNIFIRDVSVFENISMNESPIDLFNQYKSNGDLRIDAQSFGGKIKTGIISLFSKFAGLFI